MNRPAVPAEPILSLPASGVKYGAAAASSVGLPPPRQPTGTCPGSRKLLSMKTLRNGAAPWSSAGFHTDCARAQAAVAGDASARCTPVESGPDGVFNASAHTV
jgi:hypothetical protein